MIQPAVDWLLYSLFRLDPESHLAGALNFFIYDTIKIGLLLFFMISVLGFLRSFLDQKRIKGWLSHNPFLASLYASVFGAITPFCSCSSIPIFLSFVKMGIPLGVMFAFLITSPMINEYLVVLMLSFFGWKITLAYVVSGMAIGIGAGLILGKMKLEKYLERDIISSPEEEETENRAYKNIRERILFGIGEAKTILARLWVWIMLGVGLGAVIHNYVPQEAIRVATDKAGLFSVPIAVGLGVPMYGSCAAIVPIAVALFQKGVPLGTALSFMMATSTLSLPEAVILRRAMKLKLILIFFGITTLGIIFTGYLFNILQKMLI